MASQRFRKFFCITYDTLEQVANFVKNERIKHFAYILHDKDFTNDGLPKEPHIHLYLEYEHARTENSLRYELDHFFIGNSFTEVCYDKPLALRYLVHADDISKTQYSADLVYTNISNFLFMETDDNTALNILDDIKNKVGFRELVKRYGREVVINYNKYRDYLTLIQQEERGETLYTLAYDDIISIMDSVSDYKVINTDIDKLTVLQKINNLEDKKNEKL